MLDKDAFFDIEKLRISCKLKIFQNKTCVKDPSVVTQKNEITLSKSDVRADEPLNVSSLNLLDVFSMILS